MKTAIKMINKRVLSDLKEFLEGGNMTIMDIENLKIPTSPLTSKERKRKALNLGDVIKVWKFIYDENFDGICKICDKTEMSLENRQSWEISHIIAFSNGGDESLENLRPLCRSCNRSMRNVSLKEYCEKNYPERCQEIFQALKL